MFLLASRRRKADIAMLEEVFKELKRNWARMGQYDEAGENSGEGANILSSP
jgi:hypothetical protein